jgi:hypothetical protein
VREGHVGCELHRGVLRLRMETGSDDLVTLEVPVDDPGVPVVLRMVAEWLAAGCREDVRMGEWSCSVPLRDRARLAAEVDAVLASVCVLVREAEA